MTRQEKLLQLVGSLALSIDMGPNADSEAEVVTQVVRVAGLFLAEIERVCPEATTCPTCVVSKQAVADAVAAQREKDAKIAEKHSSPSDGWLTNIIAAAIRRGE